MKRLAFMRFILLASCATTGTKRELPGMALNELHGSSRGGVGNWEAHIRFKKEAMASGEITARIGRKPSVALRFHEGRRIAGLVEQIIGTGVLNLPRENRKKQRAGVDMALVTIEAKSRAGNIAVIRDYHWGKSFERSFQRAQDFFLQIAAAVTRREASTSPVFDQHLGLTENEVLRKNGQPRSTTVRSAGKLGGELRAVLITMVPSPETPVKELYYKSGQAEKIFWLTRPSSGEWTVISDLDNPHGAVF